MRTRRWLFALAMLALVKSGLVTTRSAPASVNMSTDLITLGIAGQNLVPNQPSLDARPLFQAALQYVKTNNVPLLTANTGAYYFLTPVQTDRFTSLFQLSNLTIDFAGSTIYFAHSYRQGFALSDSHHVTLKNFQIDYVTPPYTHALITSVNTSARRLFYVPIAGWPDPTSLNNAPAIFGGNEMWAAVFRNGQVVAGTSRMKVDSPLPGGRVDLTQDGTPWTQPGALGAIKPGDTIVVAARGGSGPVNLFRVDSSVLSNITIYGASQWAAVIDQVSNTTLDGVRVMPRPGTGLIGSNADGIHLSSARQNNVVRNCYVTRTLDDGIAIDSLAAGTILRRDGPRQVRVRRFGWYRFANGTPLNFVDRATTAELAGGIVVSQSPPDSAPTVFDGEVDLVFDRDLPALPIGGEVVYGSTELRGGGSVLEDNEVAEVFGRGIWISGSRGVTVRRNRLGHSSSAGIVAFQDTLAYPGPPAHDLVIESNILLGSIGPMAQESGTQSAIGAIEVGSSDNNSFSMGRIGANMNVTIRSNFVADSGRAGIWVGETNGASIQDNVIVRWNQHPESLTWGLNPTDFAIIQPDFSQPLAVRFSTNVSIAGNSSALASTLPAPVSLGAASSSFNGRAAGGTIAVESHVPGFSWKAQSDSGWLTIVTPPIKTGTGSVQYTVTPNTTGAARVGKISIAGRTFSVFQEALRNKTLDLDADSRSEFAVYRPTTGDWFMRYSSQNYVVGAGAWLYQWGLAGDGPLVGDFDGDGRTDLTVYRPTTGEWFIRYSSQNYVVGAGAWLYQWGLVGDVPLVADFDGDGRTDLTVYRPTTGEWFIRYSSQNYVVGAGAWLHQWGLAGDVPLVADFDGDGRTDLTVYRPSTGDWFIRYSSQNYVVGAGAWLQQWGLVGDVPIVGDFDGDGRTDLTVYRPSTGDWYIRYSTLSYAVAGAFGLYQWGLPGDLPLVADFDGDGRTELTVYRPTSGEWFIRHSTTGYSLGTYAVYQWGLVGDLALPR